MTLSDRSAINPSAFALCLLVITGFAASSQAQLPVSQQAWSSFGHDRQWKVAEDFSSSLLNLEWTRKLGDGKSQIIGNRKALIVASGEKVASSSNDEAIVRTLVSAVATSDGKPIWEYVRSDVMHPDQQTFGGNKPSPQATPLLLGQRLLVLGFTGVLVCLDANSGKALWEVDLVKKFQATPVQFGFASSPVAVQSSDDEFVVLAAGGKGGLIRMSAKDGEVRWVSPVDSFSYATPTWATISGIGQWLIISRTVACGISAKGNKLWQSELKEQGLTNAPSPLVVGSHRILLSGQGMDGTQCLEVDLNKEGEWKVEEAWHNRRLQFFYTNWLQLTDQVVLGCTLQYLAAFDVRSGEVLGRWREYRDGNLLQVGNRLQLLDGKGKLTEFSSKDKDSTWEAKRTFQLTDERCWVAPSIVGGRLLVRFGDSVACYSFSESESSETVKQLANAKATQLSFASETAKKPDPVLEIMETFEQKGQQAALSVYQQYRTSGTLTVEHRIALAEAAYEGGLKELANMIVTHAQADFPGSELLKRQTNKWRSGDK